MKDFEEKKIFDSYVNDDELDLSDIVNFFKRNLKFISIITLFSLSFGVIYSLRIKPTWQGEFQIVLHNEKSPTPSISSKLGDKIFPGIASVKSGAKTEVEILKSPFVMKPVFNLFKELNTDEKNKLSKLSYKKWIKQNLNIELINDTQVLSVKYKDQKKSSIIPILNLVSKEYQSYSDRDRNIGLSNSINYVKVQIKEKKEETKKSFFALREFSMKNNIGDFDGMIPTNSITNSEGKEQTISPRSNSSLRYTSQFRMLEELETKLIEKSALYKNDSDVIKLLKLKINSIKESLKRPKEILLKYRELEREAILNENALNQLEGQLTFLNIEKLKKSQPWTLISIPNLNDTQVAPKKKSIVSFWGFASLILASIFFLLLEGKKGIIFSEKKLIKIIPFKLMKSIDIKNGVFNFDDLEILTKVCFNDKKAKYKLINLENSKNISNLLLDQLVEKSKDSNISVLNKVCDLTNDNKNYLIIEEGKITFKEISKFIQDINLSNLDIIGWFYIKKSV